METSLIGKAVDFGSTECGFESHVSKLTPYYTHAYVINHVNILLSRKQRYIEIVLTRKTLKLVRTFYKYGIIRNYIILQKLEKRKIVSYIRFNGVFFKGESYYRSVRLVSSPSRKHNISLKGLNLIRHSVGHSLIILETSRGLISHKEALRFGTGGAILCVID